MAGFEDIVNLNLQGGAALAWLSTAYQIVMIIVIVVILGIIFYYISKFLKYNVDVELYEKKGDKLEYLGDDKVRRVSKEGITKAVFLKNREEKFKGNLFPQSKYIFRKKWFGTKTKAIIDGDEIIWWRPQVGDDLNLTINAFETHQKIAYLQRQKGYAERYKKDDDNLAKGTIIIAVTLVGVILFGLFVIWQSNVATAEATRQLAAAIAQDVASRAPTIPSGP